jgi:hypothetical protein
MAAADAPKQKKAAQPSSDDAINAFAGGLLTDLSQAPT